jgi:dTDP-4-dehydrorhamnose reductase
LSLSSPVAFVTGASGALGWVLARKLAAQQTVVASYHSHSACPEGTTCVRLNLEEPGGIAHLLDEYRPRTIFHLAALTAPDECERSPELARRVNLDATREIARWAGGRRSKMVFASTDLVFGGDRGGYTEEDKPAPLSVYGRTKLDAELAVLEACPGATVIRGSLFYGLAGASGRTFLSDLLDRLSKGEKMRLFTDQVRNPIWLEDLARAMSTAVERGLSGIYHVAGDEAVSRFEFGRAVCEAFGFCQGLLVPIKMADFDYVARRPLDSTLNTHKFHAATGFEPTPLTEALARVAGAQPTAEQ